MGVHLRNTFFFTFGRHNANCFEDPIELVSRLGGAVVPLMFSRCRKELMVDVVTQALRSKIMAGIRSKDTRPEMIVRRLLHKAGYRYRLHVAELPGKPDLVFVRRKKVIFIHGCFWHMHECCGQARIPKSNVEFWVEKLRRNRERDDRNLFALQQLGWSVLIVWECELRNAKLLEHLQQFMEEEYLPENRPKER